MRKTNFANINILILILISFISFILTGCLSTEGTLDLKGKVSEENTKNRISWKNIIVQGVDYSNGKPETIEAGQFSTDSSGNFTFKLKKIRGVYDYNFCFLGNPDYPVTILHHSLINLKENAKYIDFSLNKLADLTIKLSRKSKRPLCDTLRLCWESNGIFGASMHPYKICNYDNSDNSVILSQPKDLIWIGGSVHSTVTTKVYSNKLTKLTWELYRNGRRLEFYDTITCKRDIANIVYFSY